MKLVPGLCVSVPIIGAFAASLPAFSAGAVVDSPNNSTVYPIRTLWSWGKDVWPENLFVRSNGKILGGLATSPTLYSFDPEDPTMPPQTVHTFEGKSSVFAITETQEDLFYVIVNNFTFAGNLKAIRGTNSIWEIDLRVNQRRNSSSWGPRVEKLTDIPSAGYLDGMDTLNAEKGLLVTGDGNSTDTIGSIILIDTIKRTATTAFSSPLLKGGATTAGIDGIRVHNGYVYYTNAGNGFLARFQVDMDTGKNTSQIEVLQTGLHPVDDFFFDWLGNMFVTLSDIGVAKFSPPDYKNYEIIANVSGSTACRLGTTERQRGKMFVTADGGIDGFKTGKFVNPATLVEIDLEKSLQNPQG